MKMNIKRRQHFSTVVFLFILSFFLQSTVCAKKPTDWSSVKKSIKKDFPDVENITTQELSDLLSTPDTIVPIIIDARESEEYAVSHLQNALHADTKEKAVEVLKDVNKDTLIVVYCSVGYRSGSLVKQLIDIGFNNIYNLKGSIFKWANENRPVFKGDKQVKSVHPYDKEWGKLLKKEFWSFTPEK